MLKDQLINMAKTFIENDFLEDSLRRDTIQYIEYKFNESVYFAKITQAHFWAFRENKDKIEEVKAMTIIELIILASDIMDDMQDKDAKDTPWSDVEDAFNLNIIIGILLISMKEIEGVGSNVDKKWIQKNVYSPLLQSINGQHIDLKNQLMSESDYLQMCFLKSGSLISLACFLGAGNIRRKLREKIDEYSKYLGVIFQLRNDISDMRNGFIKSDLFFKKRTLPVIYYLNTDDRAYESIQNYYLNNSSNLDVIKVHQDLMKGDALLYCSTVEKVFMHKYKKIVNQLNLSQENTDLLLSIIATQQEEPN
ncbi:polyprenyl synthetase family protein [Virgibacillus sp. Bac330]|uniref:polyprenyl synthetase family protein n=1 Tax=Virgibacillus sp. Bac330 TaxID=2419841 RepID=UPI000EF44D4F|nr:polyprenyl synthetase family protein [Virgibacillus sp. Bac330]